MRVGCFAGSASNEDDQFTSLQQHIDELTEQKFELARGLEKQQQIAASLAAENQRLLDDYNQQVKPSQYSSVCTACSLNGMPSKAVMHSFTQLTVHSASLVLDARLSCPRYINPVPN